MTTATVLERVSYKKIKVFSQNNVNFKFLVISCVKVGEKCVKSEGVTIGAVMLLLVKCFDNKMV